MAQKDKVKELVGRGLGSYHTKSLQQIDRIEKKNKEQNHKINILTNELDNDYITKSEEGSVISLEHSKEGMVYIDELEGNTLVNYCTDGSKELTLNDEIDTEGINVTLNNTIDNGIVDISLEGNTMVNICDQKEPVAITKSYTVENSGNHIALQGEYDGKARPVIQGNTMVNYCVDGAKELTLNNKIDIQGTSVTLTDTVDNGLVDVVCEGNTLVNMFSGKISDLYGGSYRKEEDGYITLVKKTYGDCIHLKTDMYKPNTDYTLIVDVKENTLSSTANLLTDSRTYIKSTNGYIEAGKTGIFKIKFTTIDDFSTTKDNLRWGFYLSYAQLDEITRGDITLKFILLEGDWTDKEIPEYFEGMKSVGECEDNKIEILSNNGSLIDFDITKASKVNCSIVGNSEKFTITTDGSASAFKYIIFPLNYTFKKGVTYTFNAIPKKIEGTPRAYVRLLYKDNTIEISNQDVGSSGKKTFTPTEDITDMRLWFYGSFNNASQNGIFEVSNVIISLDNNLSYRPYALNKKEISLNEPLRGLPNGVKDKFVKQGGKWYVERNCLAMTFNGSEDWVKAYESVYRYRMTFRQGTNDVANDLISNNRLVTTYINYQDINYDNYIYSTEDGLNIIKFNSSIDDIKQELKNNPMEIVYQLATPTYEEIEDVELITYLDITHISNNSTIPCNMQVKNTGYNTIIKPNTKYTIVLDTNKAGIIGINLGGTEISTSNKITTITTPSTLVDNTLKLSGQEINVDKVMLFEGDLTQTPSLIPTEYVEGLKSSFEDNLVTDVNDPNYGKYKVEYKVTGKNLIDLNNVITNSYNHIVDMKYPDNSVIIHRDEWWNGPLEVTDTGVRWETIDNATYKGIVVVCHLKPNTTYTLSFNALTEINVYGQGYKTRTFTTDSNGYYKTTLECANLGYGEITNIQLEEGTTATEYEAFKSSTKTFYLNSPLLEGDTIEDVNGKATHVHRRGSKLLDGSEEGWYLWDVSSSLINTIAFAMPTNGKNGVDEANNSSTVFGNTICDKFIESTEIIDSEWHMTHSSIAANNRWWSICINKTKLSTQDVTGFKQWLQANPITIIYQLASPIYETISEESILCDSYVNGHLDFNSAIPVKKVAFGYNAIALKYVQPSTKYTIQFESDGVGKVELLNIGGKTYPYLNKDVVKGLNKITVETIQSPTHNLLIMVGIGFNASNISVVATDKEFEYFEGMKSVAECEDNKIEIISAKVKEYITGTLGAYSAQRKPIFNFVDNPTNGEASSSELEPYLKYFNNCGNFDNCNNLFDYYRVSEGYWVNLGVWGTTYNDSLKAKEVINKYIGECEGNKKEISLNEPLRALPNGVCDKFVKQSGKWYVERNCGEKFIDGSDVAYTNVEAYPSDNAHCILTSKLNNLKSSGDVLCDKVPAYNDSIWMGTVIGDKNGISTVSNDWGFAIRLLNSLTSVEKADDKETVKSKFRTYLQSNPITIIYQLETPIYEPITDAELITYLDTTHISNNSTIPCNMKVTNSGYNAIIKPSTLYTVALDTDKSGTVGINLGGAKVTTTNNVATITTPATLADDSLRLHGKGIKASKVRLLEGDKTNWIPSFFEGMKSSFEDKLQDDGTFKMEILSCNENLFNNDFNKRFENGDYVKSSPYIYFPVNVNKNKNYTCYIDAKDLPLDAYCNIATRTYYDYPLFTTVFSGTTEPNLTVTKTVLRTTLNNCNNKIYVSLAFNKGNIQQVEEYLKSGKFKVKVVEQGNNLSFIPHKSNKIQFSSIEPLRGIGDVKDRFVFKDGKLMIERNTIKIVLNGSEAWGIYPNQINRPLKSKCYYMVGYDKFDISDNNSVCDIFSNVEHCYNSADINCFSDYHTAPNKYFTSFCNTLEEFKEYLKNNNATLVGKIKKPTYEEIPFELQKIILEGYENGTLSFDTNIPPTSTVTYSGETPIVKSVRLNKTEVLNNTNDINDNIVPYLMDMDYRVVCLQLEGGAENISLARLFGGTYEMLQRDILSNRYSKEEYKYRLDAYLSANKITEDEYTKLGDMLND